MLRHKLSLLRPADAGMPCGAAVFFLAILGLLLAVGRSPGPVFWTFFVLAMVASLVCLWGRVTQRYNRLRAGHCPYPLCSGSVQRGPRAQRGVVICPTCGRQWPEVPGMHFLLTHHD